MSTIPTSSVAPATTLIAFPYRYIAPSFSDVGEKIVTVGDLASIENSVISLSTLFRTISVRLIEINKSPAVVDEEIVKLWKYSGPLSGSFVFCERSTIAVSAPPVKDSPADVVILMRGKSFSNSEVSILRVYSPLTMELSCRGTPSSSVIV